MTGNSPAPVVSISGDWSSTEHVVLHILISRKRRTPHSRGAAMRYWFAIENLFLRNHLADTVAGGDVQFVPIGTWQVLNGEGRRKYLSAAERRALLAAADTAPASIRALVYVLTFSGCRISEALNLTSHHIDVEQCRLIVKTLKRRRLVYRAIPVPRQVIDLTAALRPSEDGRIWNMHRTTAYRHVKDLMAQTGITGPMACCRGLRHGYGIHAAASRVPPNLITKWMGHADASTTAIYLDAVGQEEREFADRMWPDG